MDFIEQLYKQHKEDVYYYLLGLSRDESIAEELTSQTFLSIIVSLPSFKQESSIKTWIFSIARNHWFTYLRKEKKMLDVDEIAQFYIGSQVLLEKQFLQKECIERIYEIVEAEDEKTKLVFHYRLSGYSYQEISDYLHISSSSARVIDFRIKKKLRMILEKEDYLND